DGEDNPIVHAFNRNFPERNDGSAQTLAFIAVPETTVAYALAGTLDVNPLVDALDGIRLDEPVGDELPAKGFTEGADGFLAPPVDTSTVDVVIRAGSDRLQRLEPFPAWDGQ